jgi:hypothetical protein
MDCAGAGLTRTRTARFEEAEVGPVWHDTKKSRSSGRTLCWPSHRLAASLHRQKGMRGMRSTGTTASLDWSFDKLRWDEQTMSSTLFWMRTASVEQDGPGWLSLDHYCRAVSGCEWEKRTLVRPITRTSITLIIIIFTIAREWRPQHERVVGGCRWSAHVSSQSCRRDGVLQWVRWPFIANYRQKERQLNKNKRTL